MQTAREHELLAIKQAARQGPLVRGKSSIVLIYTLLGPAIGGVMTATVFFLDFEIQKIASGLVSNYFGILWESFIYILVALVYGAFFGYWFGGIQALACGLLLAAMSNREGRFGYFHAGLAAAFIAIVAAAFFVSIFDASLDLACFWVAAGVPSSLLLRFLFRKEFAPMNSL